MYNDRIDCHMYFSYVHLFVTYSTVDYNSHILSGNIYNIFINEYQILMIHIK